jgi:hypothetical protein
MHDEPTGAAPPRDPERTQAVVTAQLLSGEHPWPWSVRELALELGDELAAADAVVALQAAGLIHRVGGFVWPTRAAARMHEIGAA